MLTRAFTGRLARGIANAWTEGVGRQAPSAYPELHHVTAACVPTVAPSPILTSSTSGPGPATGRVVTSPPATSIAALAAELRAAR